MDNTWLAIGERWGIPTLACLAFFYLLIRYVVPALARATLEQLKTVTESSEKNTTTITTAAKENIKTVMESNEREQTNSRAEFKEALKQQAEHSEKMLQKIAEMQQKNIEHNFQIHQLYADNIRSVAGKLDGVVTELREFKDEISQRIEEVQISFQKL